jgi:hypothetical protein
MRHCSENRKLSEFRSEPFRGRENDLEFPFKPFSGRENTSEFRSETFRGRENYSEQNVAAQNFQNSVRKDDF